MNKTERLYYKHCYLKEFEARVVSAEPSGSGFRVLLDRTAFYPDSGGQPSDHGTLGKSEILDIVDEADNVAHYVKGKPAGETVKGIIDWSRRFDHMQQHTGQHVLSSAFEQVGRYKTVSFHLGAEASSIDLDSDRLSERQIEEAEKLANKVVFEDRIVNILFRSAEEANQMGLRKQTLREGTVRLIEIDQFDLSACGGTHVSRTGAIGLIALRKTERIKGLTRVEFLCGGRALRACHQDFKTLEQSARLFSGAAADLPALIAKHQGELKAAQKAKEDAATLLAGYLAAELAAGAALAKGWKVVQHVVKSGSLVDGKLLAHAIAQLPQSLALIGEEGNPARLFFAQSAGGPHNMGALMKHVAAETGAKGGGAKDFAQGGGLSSEGLEAALALAAQKLE